MTKPTLTFFFCALLLFTTVAPVEAGRFRHCECVGDYTPPRGVLKMFTTRVRTEWEERHHCLPCGRKVPYKVKVITYRERYTDGSSRTWKCVVAGSETPLDLVRSGK